MFVYNVTVNVEEAVHLEWLQWMQKVHVPDVMKTGCFIDSQILKLLFVEDEGHTYTVQYKFLEMTDLENYQKNHSPALQAEHKKKFGNNTSAFRTVMEHIR